MKYHLGNILSVLLLLGVCCSEGIAQRNPSTATFPNTTAATDSFPVQDTLPFERVPDTVSITYILADNPGKTHVYTDSLLGYDFRQADPSRARRRPYANLGNIGSAARPLVYEMRLRQGFDVGLHSYDLYHKKPEDLSFFTLQPAFTHLQYSQGNDQNDSRIQADFGRKFAGGIKMRLTYERLIHSLEDNALALNQNIFYPYQSARHTNLGVGFSYQSPRKRYEAFLTYFYTQNRDIHHGGIVPTVANDSILLSGNQLEQQSLPVLQGNETATTTYRNNHLLFTHHVHLGGKPDSVSINKRDFLLTHQFSYKNASYKFSETAPDSSYYGDFLTDTRGLRYFIEHRSIENRFWVGTSKKRDDQNAVPNQGDLLQVGVLHRANQVNQEAADTTVQNLLLLGRWNFSPNPRLDIQTYAQLNLWNQAGDYQWRGNFWIDFNNIGKVLLFAKQQLYEPSLVQTRAYMSERVLWQNTFNKILATEVGGAWTHPDWKVRIEAHYFLLNNLVYFDENAQPQQAGQAINVGQLALEKDFVFGVFHLDNRIVFQQTSEQSILRIPSVLGMHSLYLQGRLFRQKMFANIGFDVFWNTTYTADTFQPAIGQFHLQNLRDVQFYPSIDAFVSFKIDRLRFFMKMENLSALVLDEVYEQTPYFPQKEQYFRFGLSWQFLDLMGNSKPTRRR